jgi:prolyl oligopeptidase
MKRLHRILGLLAITSPSSCAEPPRPSVPPVTTATPPSRAPAEEGRRPLTRTSETVETLHGVAVTDPYRWLEDGASPEVKAWTDDQNARTRRYLDAIEGRGRLEKEITSALEVGFVAAPQARRGERVARYFHLKREGAQNQPRLYAREGQGGEDRVLIDVASLSADGTTALDWWYPSRDGRLVAWGASESGTEDSVLHVRDVATGKDLPDRIDRTRFASIAWLPDGKRFYYSRYPAPGTVPPGEERYHARIYLHALGQDPKDDALVFGEGRGKTDIPDVLVSPNGRWLVVHVHMGWDRSEVYVKDLAKRGAPWRPVVERVAALFDPQVEDDRLWIHTNDGSPRYRLFAVDYGHLDRSSWREVIPEGKDVLRDVEILKSELVASYLHDASSRLERFTHDGRSKGAIALPSLGSASTSRLEGSDELFVGFSSYVVPSEVHRVDLRHGARLAPWDRVASASSARADDVEVTQAFAQSKDGTRVPMFVVAKRGTRRDGQNPTILSGYGGFNLNQTPAFSERILTAVRNGAVWVTAVLRGGGEYGEGWHEAGMLAKKQNVFDDFYACAEALFREKITSPERLAITGGSNGGLLVAVAVTQRPEMFRAALSRVPLTDMLRYHRVGIAKLWIPEYGDPERADQFAFLHAYSPYHHVVPGTRYPATMFTTAESDTRVDPMHARKMAARLEDAQGDGSRPVLLRVESKAGHGAGKPVTKYAAEVTDELSFLLHELGAL